MKFLEMLKKIIVSKVWIKAICFLLALFVVVVINV